MKHRGFGGRKRVLVELVYDRKIRDRACGSVSASVDGVATHVESSVRLVCPKATSVCVLDILQTRRQMLQFGFSGWVDVAGLESEAFLWLSKCNASTIHFHVASMDRFHIAGWPMLLATLGT